MTYLEVRINYYVTIAKYWKNETIFLGVILLIFFACINVKITIKKVIIAELFVLYTFYILLFTVLSRYPIQIYQYKLIPFWSYVRIIYGDKNYIKEILLNIIVFIPEGHFLALFFSGWSPKKCMIAGMLFSSTIEITQLITKRRMFEFDDIIGNTIGVMLGVMITEYCRRKFVTNKS